MAISVLKCPNCGYPLPESTRANQLLRCEACGSTLYLSDWKIGESKDAVLVATPTRVYTVSTLLAKDDLCNVYRCAFEADGQRWQGLFRIARSADDNDLVQNEASTLYHLQAQPDYRDFRPFLPQVLESFLYQDAGADQAQQVNIVSLHEYIASPGELYSLEEIHHQYPSGIDARDMAWMWRRLLNILGFVHRSRAVHGAVLPAHVFIEPKEHKLALANWGFAVRDPQTGKRLQAISLPYEAWYPPELRQPIPPTPGLDLYMAARCMLYLLGDDPLDTPSPRHMEPELQHYFARCVQPNPAHRPQDAWELLRAFDRIIEQLWGPRRFRVFTMPYKPD